MKMLTCDRFQCADGYELLIETEDESLPSMHLLNQVEKGDMSPMHADSRRSATRRAFMMAVVLIRR